MPGERLEADVRRWVREEYAQASRTCVHCGWHQTNSKPDRECENERCFQNRYRETQTNPDPTTAGGASADIPGISTPSSPACPTAASGRSGPTPEAATSASASTSSQPPAQIALLLGKLREALAIPSVEFGAGDPVRSAARALLDSHPEAAWEELVRDAKVGRGYAVLLAEAEQARDVARRAYSGMCRGREREQERRESAEAAPAQIALLLGNLREAVDGFERWQNGYCRSPESGALLDAARAVLAALPKALADIVDEAKGERYVAGCERADRIAAERERDEARAALATVREELREAVEALRDGMSRVRLNASPFALNDLFGAWTTFLDAYDRLRPATAKKQGGNDAG